jgi:uncharacterized protein (TIGR02300 family)
MGRPELGSKLTCTGCSERFYDLNRSPAVCPKCGVQQALPKPRVYSKPGQSWRPRRPMGPVAAEPDDGNAVVASEAEDTEEAADEAADEVAEDGADSDLDGETEGEAAGAKT